jgi:LysR family transcriptional activator of nhaA
MPRGHLHKKQIISKFHIEKYRMNQPLNYHHLYYFWVAAREGGIARGAERLGMAVQTVSAQIRQLEQSLGHALLRPAGRGVVLTEAGRVAVARAELIFELGAALPALVRDAASTPVVRLAVGISDGLPKSAARRLLQAVMDEPHLRLRCDEDEFDDLLGDLLLHRLDVVLSDRPAPARPGVRIYSHPLGSAAIGWYAVPELAAAAIKEFPESLAQVPLLLPTHHSALRAPLDQWLETLGIRATVVGEFEDSSLLATFGASGLGIFPAPILSDQHALPSGLVEIGRCDGVRAQFHAIVAERRIEHPLVKRLLAQTFQSRS